VPERGAIQLINVTARAYGKPPSRSFDRIGGR
jgi:hypothetical protein